MDNMDRRGMAPRYDIVEDMANILLRAVTEDHS